MASAYRAAGVDIDAGNALVEAIKPYARSTARAGTAAGLGGFGAFFDLKAAGFKDPVLVATTDGVGTKLKIAIETGRSESIGKDLVAMCVNDLAVQGAEPLFFLDYFATGRLDVTQGETIIRGIAEACAECGCALIGGETAEMPGLYARGDYDLAGFAVGAVERGQELTGVGVGEGDVVLGLQSTGVHSNGYSLVRKIITDAGLGYDAPAPFEKDASLADVLLRPTRLYVKSTLAAHRAGLLKALAHITGGGLLENIPRVLPKGLSVTLDRAAWPLLPVFAWLAEKAGLSAHDLARTFNCGIGMVAIASPQNAAAAIQTLTAAGETVTRIGTVTRAPDDKAAERVVLTGTAEGWPA